MGSTEQIPTGFLSFPWINQSRPWISLSFVWFCGFGFLWFWGFFCVLGVFFCSFVGLSHRKIGTLVSQIPISSPRQLRDFGKLQEREKKKHGKTGKLTGFFLEKLHLGIQGITESRPSFFSSGEAKLWRKLWNYIPSQQGIWKKKGISPTCSTVLIPKWGIPEVAPTRKRRPRVPKAWL